MGLRLILKGAIAAGAISMFGATGALAQGAGCEETQMTSKVGEVYLKAENELLQNDNPQGALVHLNKLRSMELNCLEQGVVLQLGAAIKIQSDDYLGAAQDLQTAIDQGYITGDKVASTYYQIFQIFLSENDLQKSLQYADRWMNAGGKPDRDDMWRLAIVNQKIERNQESLKWAERVFEIDGPDAKREVYDFLIYLYDATGQRAKKARLLEQLLAKNPNERKLWDAIAGDYYQANEERKAFEVQKAMYLGGILQTEDELMRIVNFYNRFDVPYHAARTLEKEMNAGRITKNYTRLELLANLYQVAREFDKAIPVIEEAARLNNSGEMYERLGRSYAELQNWEKTEQAMNQALQAGNLKDRGLAWVLIGQSRYERDDRAGAREAFRNANNRGGRGWLSFMDSEERTEAALVRFEAQSLVQDTKNEKQRCDRLSVLGEENVPEDCKTVDERLKAAEAALDELGNS